MVVLCVALNGSLSDAIEKPTNFGSIKDFGLENFPHLCYKHVTSNGSLNDAIEKMPYIKSNVCNV